MARLSCVDLASSLSVFGYLNHRLKRGGIENGSHVTLGCKGWRGNFKGGSNSAILCFVDCSMQLAEKTHNF